MKRLLAVALGAVLLFATGWGALVLLFAGPARVAWAQACLAAVYGLGSVAVLLWLRPFRRALAVWGVGMLAILVWWSSLRPSNDLDWQPDVVVLLAASAGSCCTRRAGGRLGRAYGLAAAVDTSGGASRPPTRSEHGHLQMDSAKATSNPSAVGWSRPWGTGPADYKPECWSLGSSGSCRSLPCPVGVDPTSRSMTSTPCSPK